jgi:hypothetical protein
VSPVGLRLSLKGLLAQRATVEKTANKLVRRVEAGPSPSYIRSALVGSRSGRQMGKQALTICYAGHISIFNVNVWRLATPFGLLESMGF